MAYGSASGVAKYARVWTRAGVFYDAALNVSPTRPTLSDVENWIDEVSASFDLALQNEGFDSPVLQADAPNAYLQLVRKVETLVSDLCFYANNQGRLYTDRSIGAASPSMLDDEILKWVKTRATGLENDGVPRSLGISEYSGGFSVSPNRQV